MIVTGRTEDSNQATRIRLSQPLFLKVLHICTKIYNILYMKKCTVKKIFTVVLQKTLHPLHWTQNKYKKAGLRTLTKSDTSCTVYDHTIHLPPFCVFHKTIRSLDQHFPGLEMCYFHAFSLEAIQQCSLPHTDLPWYDITSFFSSGYMKNLISWVSILKVKHNQTPNVLWS